MNFSIDSGHNCYPDTGAQGIKSEDVLTKELVGLLNLKLKSLGHTVTDCTPYGQAFQSVLGSLGYRVKVANQSGSQFHLCIHFNACIGGHGVEVFCMSATDIATKICAEISALGFANRGVKDGSGLFIIKYSSMPSVLIECAFVDSEDDMNRYNAEDMANAIIKAITGQVTQPVIAITPPSDTITIQTQLQSNVAKAKSYVGNRCLELQQKLNKLGYKLTEDNDFGQNTYNAVIEFQTRYLGSNNVDGLFGTQSFIKLNSVIASLNISMQIHQSSVDNNILLIQKKLNRLHIGNRLVEDGISGSNTVSGIKLFQSICGIDSDGDWGNQSENCYQQITSKQLCGVSYVQRVPTRYLQYRLGISNDGVFGNGTKQTVINWQSRNGLDADGVVGNGTWSKLI